MNDADLAASFAIFVAKQRGCAEVTADHLLLGCLRAVSRFGIVTLGGWNLDLEALGVDWVKPPEGSRGKVAYSQDAVDLFDRAAQIACAGQGAVGVEHLLAAFAGEEGGLMGELKRAHGITSAAWRAAIAKLGADEPGASNSRPEPAARKSREYLTPEEAAETLGIHVQTMRAYIRSGRLPAFRVAGERAIRIRREDLEKVLEPLDNKS
jgi:excisionase family DNA binding protein